MRSLLVVFTTKPVEASLLRAQIRRRRDGCLFFERPMHPLVYRVVLRRAGAGADLVNSKLDQPHAESRQAGQALRRDKRFPVVRTNRIRKTMLAEPALQRRSCVPIRRTEHSLANK